MLKGSAKHTRIDKLSVPLEIPDNATVTVKETGNVTEIMFTQKQNTECYIRKLDKERYCDLRTGEVKNFNHTDNRSDNLKSVAKSLRKGHEYLNTNITDVSKCRWLTLTYRENMTDPKRLYKDFENFNSRLRKIFGHYEYITAAEPQGRGAWHLHAVLIFKDTAPYMSNEIVAKAWKRGFVKITALKNVDNVGAYLTAYLGDMELSEAEKENHDINTKNIKTLEIEDDTGQIRKKKFVKGARMRLYPPQFHIFRYSRGIKKPAVTLQSYEQAKENISSAKLTFKKSVLLSDDETGFANTLTYEYYNSTRK